MILANLIIGCVAIGVSQQTYGLADDVRGLTIVLVPLLLADCIVISRAHRSLSWLGLHFERKAEEERARLRKLREGQ